MKTRTPLDEFIDRLVQKNPAGDSTLAIPRHVHAPEDKWPSDKHLERDTKRDGGVTLPGGTDSGLATAYRRYWTLPETAPTEAFGEVYGEIARLERQTPPQAAWATLRQTAITYHQETGICPFCRVRGDLHLPDEQMSLELSGGQA